MEPKELDPDVAEKILDADFQNIVKKVAAGKPLTVAERTRIESRAAGSTESTAYAKTKVELAELLGVSRRTLTAWQRWKGDWRKGLVAGAIRSRSLVPNDWIAERLQMGARNAVSRTVRHAREHLKANREARRLATRLKKLVQEG